MLIDTHCHLNDKAYNEDYKEIAGRLGQDGVDIAICIGEDFETSKKGLKIAKDYPNIFCALGVHPHYAKDYNDECEKFFTDNANNNKVVAIGEIGLDYYYEYSDRQTQKAVLIKQIRLADKLGLPVVFHLRDAFDDFIEILLQHKQYLRRGAVVHSFNESYAEFEQFAAMGFFIGLNGMITFKNYKKTEMLKRIPLEKIILETDAPYLAPEPFRGKRCEPKHVVQVAKKLAEAKGITLDEVLQVTCKNAKELFGLKE